MDLSGIYKNYFKLTTPQAFAVDFNNEMLKVFQLKQKKKGVLGVQGWNKRFFAKGTVENYEIKNVDAFTDVFQSCIREANGTIRGKGLVVSLPENKIFARVISIPNIDEKDAAETIKWETESNIPIPIDEVYFDWQIIEREEKTMKVLVLACPRKVIDNYLAAFSAVGFEVVAFEAVSVASGRGAIKAADNSSILLVDMGLENTSFAIYKNNCPVFSSSGSTSGKIMTDVIAKYFGISYEKAESYKHKVGLGSNVKEREEALEVLNPLLMSLSMEIERTVSFFEDNLISKEGESIEKIVLCGGGANLKGLSSYLALTVHRPLVIANPWENISFYKEIPPISLEEAQSYITAIGLALRALHYEDYN